MRAAPLSTRFLLVLVVAAVGGNVTPDAAWA